MSRLPVTAVADGVSLEVSLRPRSRRPGAGAVRDGALELRVSAPPVEGKANEAARRILADLLGVPPSRIDLARGARSKRKVFRIRGLTADEAIRRLGEKVKTS